MKAITIGGIDPDMAERLEEVSSRQGKSINQLVLDILRQELGMEKRKRYTRTYDDLNLLWVIFPAPWGVQCFWEYPAACGGVVY